LSVVADELLLVIRAEVGNAVAGLQKVEDKARTTGSNVGQSMTNMGKKLALGATLPILGMGVAAVDAASDLEEATSKAATVFGESIAGIEAAANSTADALSRSEYLDFAGTLGTILQGMEFTVDESAKMSEGFMTLAQDLASFHNVPVEQALTAIKGGLTGEREALKSLGIVIDDAMVKNKAFEMGLADSEGQIDKHGMALASEALIYEKAGVAVGDYARTADGLANSKKNLMGNIKDMLAVMGEKLLPIVQSLVGWIGKAVEFFTNLPGPVQTIIMVVLGLVAAIGPLLMILGPMVSGFMALSAAAAAAGTTIGAVALPVLAVVAAIAAAVAIAIYLWKNWDTIWPAIKKTAVAVWTAIKNFFKATWDFIKGVFEGVINFIKNLVTTVFNFIKGYFQTVFGIYKAIIKGAWDFITGVIKGAIDIVKKVIKGGFDIVKTIVSGVWTFFRDKINAAKTIIVGGFEWIRDKVVSVFGGIGDAVRNGFKGAINFLIDGINMGIKGINKLIDGFNKLPVPDLGKIPLIPKLGFGGSNLAGGSYIVGDRGRPEMVTLPHGSSVTPMRGRGEGIVINLNAPQNDPLGVAREVGWQLMKRGA
jgi:phage-related protein